jgi:hypothetical protein
MTDVAKEKVIAAVTLEPNELNKRVADAIDMSFAKLHNKGIIEVQTVENFSLFSKKDDKYTTWIIFAIVILLVFCIIFFFK